jgi:RNA polymerase sigma factor (sigma-70 family)
MEHPAAYARRILVNLVLDGAKRRARHQAELEQRAGPTFERGDEGVAQEMSSVEARFVLVRALGALAPRQRATLVLRYFDDLTEVATAEVMGCSVGTVKSTASRALDHLRAELAPTVSDSPPRDTPPLVTQHGTHQRSEPT